MEFPVSFFEFPLNLILAFAWCFSVWFLWHNNRNNPLVKFFLSPAATWISISLCASGCLVMGLSSNRSLAASWWFVTEMFFLLTVLLFVTFRGWRRYGKVRWRFLLNHTGLLLAAGAAFWGAPDEETLRMQLFRDETSSICHSLDGARHILPYDLSLNEFQVDYFENGVPSVFEATVSVDGREVSLRVNHPYRKSFSEDIYLSSYGVENGKEYCILQIVREPWKWVSAFGIILMMSGAVLMFTRGPLRREPSHSQSLKEVKVL